MGRGRRETTGWDAQAKNTWGCRIPALGAVNWRPKGVGGGAMRVDAQTHLLGFS